MQELAAADRHRLIEDHLQIPVSVAATFPQFRSTGTEDFDDIVADGCTGLVEAANKFDPTRGNTFKTFAWHRVRGAILDSARRLSPLSRNDHDRQLKSTDGTPSPVHVPLNIREAGSDDGSGDPLDGEVAAGGAREYWPDIEDAIDRRRVLARTLVEVARLPARERALVESFYVAGRTMQETAATLGYCEFYTSRLHGRLLRKLRQALTLTGDAPAAAGSGA